MSEKKVLEDFEKLIGAKIRDVSKPSPQPTGFRIEEGKITALGFFSQKLKSLPESLGYLDSLKYIDLESNFLTTLPESFGNLISLEYLNLQNNQIKSLPESFGNLKSLKYLDLHNNQLTKLPESFANLNSLQEIRLDNNQLTTLPESFANINSLQELRLDNNLLSSLPESIDKLNSLQKLWIYQNKLTTLPKSIGNFNSLETLGLSGNQLTSLPESIGNLKSLKILGLSSNQLIILPESFSKLSTLQTLYINNNPLKEFPEQINSIDSLQNLISDYDETSSPQEFFNEKDSIQEDRLQKYNIKKMLIEYRQSNVGKYIIDNLPTVTIDPDTLDLYSELHPVQELPGIMSRKATLLSKLEWPKWGKRNKIVEYGWGTLKTIIKMDLNKIALKNFNVKMKIEDLSLLKNEIKEYAESFGFICGFTKIDRRFIAEGKDENFPFDTALLCGFPMEWELILQVPHPKEKLFDFEAYVKLGSLVFDVAQFIKSKGYNCHARSPIDGGIKYVPHAINAGLGELSANGIVQTREFGSKIRWTMISIDADIEPDKPVDLNIAAYCDACKLCIITCPGKAITKERIWWRGVLKRKINTMKCWPYFEKYDGCGICLKICPINKFGYEQCMDAFKKDGTILKKRSSLEENWWDVKLTIDH